MGRFAEENGGHWFSYLPQVMKKALQTLKKKARPKWKEKRERGKNTHVCKAPYRSTLFVSNFPFQNLRQLIRSSSPLPTTTLRAILFGTNTQRTHVQIQTGKLTHFTPREIFLGEALSFSMRPAGPSSSSWVSRVDGEAAIVRKSYRAPTFHRFSQLFEIVLSHRFACGPVVSVTLGKYFLFKCSRPIKKVSFFIICIKILCNGGFPWLGFYEHYCLPYLLWPQWGRFALTRCEAGLIHWNPVQASPWRGKNRSPYFLGVIAHWMNLQRCTCNGVVTCTDPTLSSLSLLFLERR